jgi:hypothetical protein
MSIDDLPHQVDSDQPNEATPLSCFDAAAEAAMAGPGAPPGRGITFTGIVTAVRNAVSNALTTAPCRSAYPRSPRRSARRSTAHHGASPLFPTGALGNPRRHPSRRPVHKASTRASRVRTPHRSNETLRPSTLIWTCPLACKCSPRRSSHFPTVQRSSGPPPSAVPSGYGPPPGMADGGTRQQAQAGGIHPLEQVRSPLIALDCRPAASTPSSRCVIAADSR